MCFSACGGSARVVKRSPPKPMPVEAILGKWRSNTFNVGYMYVKKTANGNLEVRYKDYNGKQVVYKATYKNNVLHYKTPRVKHRRGSKFFMAHSENFAHMSYQLY